MGANEAQLAAYANNGRNWDQLCQALVWNWCDQFGSAPVVYPSALDAYYATPIVSTDVYSAPPGACIFFDIGAYGHTDIRVDNGRDGMASGRVSEFWGVNAGEVDIASYIAQTGAWPLGWGWTNGANSFQFEAAGAPLPIPVPPPPPPPLWVKFDKEEDTMFMLKINDAENRYTGGILVAVTGPGYWFVTTNVEAGNTLAVRFGDAANVSYAEWNQAAAVSGVDDPVYSGK